MSRWKEEEGGRGAETLKESEQDLSRPLAEAEVRTGGGSGIRHTALPSVSVVTVVTHGRGEGRPYRLHTHCPHYTSHYKLAYDVLRLCACASLNYRYIV